MIVTRSAFLKWVYGAVALILAVGVTPVRATELPPIRHVFLIVLENEGYEITFGPHSPAPYLSRRLVSQGALLRNYYGIGHFSLDNYIAMISGQAPNAATQSDCQSFTEFSGNTLDADGQAIGSGCVYPANVPTIANQLEGAHLTWKSYSEDMGNDPVRDRNAVCVHANQGTDDQTQQAEPAHPADQYAARHNPFVYFHSIIDRPECASNVVNFSHLRQDMRSISTTANFVFITPNLCNDGHDGGKPNKKCVDGRPGGLKSADAFLRKWVPRLLASPAYKQDGLLIVTFDEADIDVQYDPAKHALTLKEGDASACCNEMAGPNIVSSQTVFGIPDQGPGIIGPGGGNIGAVALSRFIKAGTVSLTPYNHYSLLRTLEDIFGLAHLGYAGRPGLDSFGGDVFSQRR